MRAALKAQINKTDRNDARGIAQMMRAGLYHPVHVKTLRSQKLRMLLTHRKLLQSKAIAIENDLRATLRLSVTNKAILIHGTGKRETDRTVSALISLETGNLTAGISTLNSSISLLGNCSAQP